MYQKKKKSEKAIVLIEEYVAWGIIKSKEDFKGIVLLPVFPHLCHIVEEPDLKKG